MSFDEVVYEPNQRDIYVMQILVPMDKEYQDYRGFDSLEDAREASDWQITTYPDQEVRVVKRTVGKVQLQEEGGK